GNGVTVDVRPLPDPKPEGFDGLVGQLKLDLDIDRRELEVGEAATLTLTLSGRGHLQSMPAPDLGDIEGLQVMAPQQQSEEKLRGEQVEGRRVWKWVMVPKRPGEHVVPGLDIPFYDPRRGQYRTASTESVQLSVRGASRVADGSQEVKLHPVRGSDLPPTSGGSLFAGAQRHWLVAAPAGLGLALILLRGRGVGRAEGKRRLKQVLAVAASEEKPRQAAGMVEEAWREYLEERWGIKRGTPTPEWAQALAQAGAPDAAAAELVQLADDLHYLRYAPKLSSTAGMRDEMIERSKRLARSL
ncbi:MAG: BatD family protein, partial [Acidobacteriota bacterium]